MTDRKTLEALRERVRNAEGPDRELDAEIMFDLFAKPAGQKDDGGPSGYLWPEDNPSWSFGIRFPGKDREWLKEVRKRNDGETLVIERDHALVLMNALRIPRLSASIDAAVALVERLRPGDHYLELSGPRRYLNIPTPVPNYWRAEVGTVGVGWGTTAPLALLDALLRCVAGALPQEPQGDVVEAMAKGIYEADSEGGFDANDPRTFWRAANSYWPPHVWDSWLAIARAALSAAEPFIQARIAAEAEDGGWQPIETAPKDGTPILVYLGATDQYVVAWDCCDPGNWREIYGDQDAIFHPAHWRPLPDLPASPDPTGQQEAVR